MNPDIMKAEAAEPSKPAVDPKYTERKYAVMPGEEGKLSREQLKRVEDAETNAIAAEFIERLKSAKKEIKDALQELGEKADEILDRALNGTLEKGEEQNN